MSDTTRPHRNTLFVEDARILAHDAYPGEQHVLRVHAPRCASHAQPGSFAHLQCDPSLPMRRPLSIMRVDADAGWVEFLYKAVGTGTRALAARVPGDTLSMIAPIGIPFTLQRQRPRTLLMGGGVGIPPMVPGIPKDTIAAMPLLEDWEVPGRLASLQGYPGCFEGYITDLARHWLDALNDEQRSEVAIFACGPHPMLAATAQLAQEYDLPCQVSLEEYMACAVGGCAGCTNAGDREPRLALDARSVRWG